MLSLDNVTIYFCTEPVDMRKSIDTLCIWVSEVLKKNPVPLYRQEKM
jgi:hypothetical protein